MSKMSWLQITAGQGPDECAWVVTKVLDQVQMEAHKKGIQVGLVEAVPGKKTDLMKSVLVSLEGNDLLAFVESWQGTVQWIGASTYRPNHKRKNWFVGIKAFHAPEEKQWDRDEIRIECMRASGPGGQHVNKSESAIRITHVPTGVSVIAQEERSQHRNRKLAFSRLDEALKQINCQAREQQQKDRWVCHIELERGNPVRVYEGSRFKRKR